MIDWDQRKIDRDAAKRAREQAESRGELDDFDAMERNTLDERDYRAILWINQRGKP